MERCWNGICQGKVELLGEKPAPVALFPPQTRMYCPRNELGLPL